MGAGARDSEGKRFVKLTQSFPIPGCDPVLIEMLADAHTDGRASYLVSWMPDGTRNALIAWVRSVKNGTHPQFQQILAQAEASDGPPSHFTNGRLVDGWEPGITDTGKMESIFCELFDEIL